MLRCGPVRPNGTMKGAARTEAGITRIEVIALIAAVLALLATGLLVGKKVGRSRDLSQCEASLKAISLGLNLWLQDNERYWFP